MAPVIYLDTHVVVWLYASGAEALSPRAAEAIARAGDLRVSPMVCLELQYLWEIGRVSEPGAVVLDALSSALGLVECAASFGAVVAEAERSPWTRDPFDRLILAHASLHGAPLVTKDEAMHRQYAEALW